MRTIWQRQSPRALGWWCAVALVIGLAGCGQDPTPKPPQITQINPNDGEVNVALNSNVTFTFDQAVQASTIDGTSNVTLKKVSDDSAVAGVVSYNTTTFSVTFDPASDLEPQTAYRIRVARSVLNTNGEPLIREYSWAFTTGRLLDVTPPDFDGAKAIDSADVDASSVRLRWDAAADDGTAAGDVTYLIYRATDTGAETYRAPTAQTAAGATSYRMTGLDPATAYFFVVLAQDAAGNLSTTLMERFATTLAAADTEPPQIDAFRPIEGEVRVRPETNVTVTFTEDMDPATFVGSTDVTTATVKLTIPPDTTTLVEGTATYNVSTLTLTFDPTVDLQGGTTYHFTLTTGVTDLAGNPLSREFSYSFTTLP